MQEGDLADGPLPDILRLLAAAHATGGVHVRRRDERGESADAVLFLREGRLYAATAPGPRPLLGVRLVAAGAVTREALEEALESQAGELAGWRLGELLVHLGYVDGEIVAEFVVEQILDTVAEVSAWVAGGWRFRRGEKTREADGLSLDIEDVLERVIERRQSWNDLEEYAGGATAVPERVPIDEALAAQQIPLARALLGEVDGVRTLAELATRCGLTTYEAGYVLAQLVEVGAVRLTPRDETSAPPSPAPPVARIVAAVAAPPARVEASLPAVVAPELSAPVEPDVSVPDRSELSAPVEPELLSVLAPLEEFAFDAEDPLGLADLLGRVPAEEQAALAPLLPEPQAVEPPEPAPETADDDLSALFGGGGDDEVDLGTQLAVLARQAEEARWAAEARHLDEVRARRAGTTAAQPAPPAEVTPQEPIGVSPVAETPVAPQPEPDVFETPQLAPYEPIGLAPIETYGLSVAEEPEPVFEVAVELAVAVESAVEAESEFEAEAVAGAPTEAAAELPAETETGAETEVEVEVDTAAPNENEHLAARLPTRSAPAAAEAVEDDFPGALATLRGAIDLEALDAPEPDRAEPEQPSHAPAWAAVTDPDRNELQSALSQFGDVAGGLDDDPADEAEWPVARSWNPDDAHDFTPDDEQPSTDTAALLRELSFLGLDDLPSAPSPKAPRPPAPRQAPVPAGKGKRKSIFGR